MLQKAFNFLLCVGLLLILYLFIYYLAAALDLTPTSFETISNCGGTENARPSGK